MDKKKSNKEEKVGSDGLTKKERRALKVQAKQTDDNKAELKINKGITEVKPEGCIAAAGEVMLNCSEKDKNLSEKQKRKLEWEKKQAELVKPTQKIELEGLSKSELKAKRREIQEAQRMSKVQSEVDKKDDINKTKKIEVIDPQIKEQLCSKPKPSDAISNGVKESKQVSFFNLLIASNTFKPVEEVYPPVVLDVHPAFTTFGTLYASGGLPGSNEKTVQFLSAIEKLFQSLEVPSGQEFCKYLETALDKCVMFLQERKHVSFSMLNALKSFKCFLTQVDKDLSEDEKKEKLTEFIDTFIQDQIITAGKAISLKVQENISDNDAILVYGWSHLIFNILVDTYKEQKKDFRVVIVDSRPSFGGEEMLRKLSAMGIKHKYVMIHGLSHVMPSVTTVLLEADALMNNGYLMSKAGTALIARMAQFYGKPVLVCCETYKFSDSVLTDAMVCNQLGKSDVLLENINKTSPLQTEQKNESTIFNILYDVTPSDLVTAVLTELAILPCCSVPVVLRIKPQE